jgi:hypothetical protein
MKPRLIFWILRHAQYAAVSLVAIIGLSSCAPAIASTPTVPIASPVGTDTLVPATATPADSSVPEATVSAPTQSVEVQAVATSRGPNLEATDPTSVSLASGQLQLIEFFRFT